MCYLCYKSRVFKARVQFFLWKPGSISETIAIQNKTSVTLFIQLFQWQRFTELFWICRENCKVDHTLLLSFRICSLFNYGISDYHFIVVIIRYFLLIYVLLTLWGSDAILNWPLFVHFGKKLLKFCLSITYGSPAIQVRSEFKWLQT